MSHEISMSAAESQNPREELERIRLKRRTLQRVFQITEAIERLYSGLESVLIMGTPAIRLPAQALAAFNDLTDKTRIMTQARLVQALEAVDREVRKSLSRILELVDEIGKRVDGLAGGEAEPLEDQVTTFIQQFRRKAQTAVALRVLLEKRGVGQIPQFPAIPKHDLNKRLKQLLAREQICGTRIKEGVSEFRKDAALILANDEVPEPIKAKVREVVAELEDELLNLQEGVKADGRSLQLETVILHSERPVDKVETPQPRPRPQPQPQSRPRPQPEPRPQPQPEQPRTTRIAATENGFWTRLQLWLATSWAVSWRDLKKPPHPPDDS